MLSLEEAAVGKRIRLVRKEYGTGQRLAGERMGLTRAQVKRIEFGQVAVRPAPALRFCEFTNRSPLWLAFGEHYNRYGFFWTSTPKADQPGRQSFQIGAMEWRSDPIVSEDTTFLQMMQKHKDRFASRAADFLATSDTEPSWRLGLREPRPGPIAQKNIESESRKHNLRQMHVGDVLDWPELRVLLRSATTRAGAKTSVARRFNVTTQAVSQWLSGKTMPSADTALRLRAWLLRKKNLLKQSADVSETPARVRKSKHERPHSDRKKH